MPSQNRFHRAPSGKMAKTWSWSTAQAVAAGDDVSVPPRDSGSAHAPFAYAPCERAPPESTQNRSIRSAPHETAAVPFVVGISPPRAEITPPVPARGRGRRRRNHRGGELLPPCLGLGLRARGRPGVGAAMASAAAPLEPRRRASRTAVLALGRPRPPAHRGSRAAWLRL